MKTVFCEETLPVYMKFPESVVLGGMPFVLYWQVSIGMIIIVQQGGDSCACMQTQHSKLLVTFNVIIHKANTFSKHIHIGCTFTTDRLSSKIVTPTLKKKNK